MSESAKTNSQIRQVDLKSDVLFALTGLLGPLIAATAVGLSAVTDSGIVENIQLIGVVLWPFWWLGWLGMGAEGVFRVAMAFLFALASNILIFFSLGIAMKRLSSRHFAVKALIFLVLFGAVWVASAALMPVVL